MFDNKFTPRTTEQQKPYEGAQKEWSCSWANNNSKLSAGVDTV